MKAMLITEYYCNSKKLSIAPITTADGVVALMELQRLGTSIFSKVLE